MTSTISLSSGASLAASAMVSARSGVTKQSFAPEFSRMKANSLACSLAFIGTAQRPACQIAYMTSIDFDAIGHGEGHAIAALQAEAAASDACSSPRPCATGRDS